LKKCCFKIPLQKWSRSFRNERCDPTPRAWLRPGLPVVPLPPRPIHGLANAEPGMVGTGALVQNFAGASLHKLYWVSVHVPRFPFLFSSLCDTYNII
jgi:hypothetical protein